MIYVGDNELKQRFVGDDEVLKVYIGDILVWEINVETGSGAIEYSFDDSTRTLTIQQESTSGNDAYSYLPTPKSLDVTTTYDYTIPPE